jgi:hypothetical protein
MAFLVLITGASQAGHSLARTHSKMSQQIHSESLQNPAKDSLDCELLFDKPSGVHRSALPRTPFLDREPSYDARRAHFWNSFRIGDKNEAAGAAGARLCHTGAV